MYDPCPLTFDMNVGHKIRFACFYTFTVSFMCHKFSGFSSLFEKSIIFSLLAVVDEEGT